MKGKDVLWFYQLILPMCEIKKSAVGKDPRQSYYSKVGTWTNIYAAHLGLGGAYSKKIENIKIDELVKWNGILICNGECGGSDGGIHRQWQEGADYDPHIDDTMQHSKLLQIKRTLKLNNNEKTSKRGEAGYDPAHKFDFLWKTIVHNFNAVTKQARLDLTGDETSWGNQGWGEPESGLVKRILNKSGVCKCGQIVLLCDQDRI
eukprot:14352308-Ditylum_brightwellii.AAC.1